MKKEEQKPFPFKMGADPEFAIVYGGNKIHVHNMLRTMSCGDSAVDMGFKTKGGIYGWDGHDATGELRPDPENTPWKLAENIGRLVEKIYGLGGVMDVCTRSTQSDPIGGHIHFEIPESIREDRNSFALRANKILSIFYIPVMLGEDLLNKKNRDRYGYGKMRDFKTQNTGHAFDSGNPIMTLEFRCPNGEWITSPEIANATLAYFGTVFNEIVFHPENIAKNKELMTMNQDQIDALERLALSQYRYMTKKMVDAIKNEIKSFEFYEQYKEEINFILNPNRVLKEKEKISFLANRGWRLDNTQKLSKEDVKKVPKLSQAEKERIEKLGAYINVSYNPNDIKCKTFARKLRETMIMNKWKLNNEYFIFGIAGMKKSYIISDQNKNIYEGQRLIKSEADKANINKMLSKMMGKYGEMRNHAGNSEFAETYKQGKLIFIGIPYQDRIGMNFDKMLEKVWNMENCHGKGISISEIKPAREGKPNKDLEETVKKEEVSDMILQGNI